MTSPVSSISGLASGIQWSDLVQQLVQLDSKRQLAPLQKQQETDTSAIAAWAGYGTSVGALDAAAQALASGTALAGFITSVGASASGRSLFSASATPDASPGTYTVEVGQLAAAEKLSGNVIGAGATTALGIAGTFAINNRTVTITATDTLADVRDRINAVNAGAVPSGVSAAIIADNAGAARLILTSQATGAAGIQLVDDAPAATGVIAQLGFTDGETATYRAANGAARSYGFASLTEPIATAAGLTAPAAATVTLGGVAVSVDLATDTIASIAARIVAAGGSATVVTDSGGAVAQNYLDVSGAVSASTPDGQHALEILGIVRGTRGAVQQSAVTGATLTRSDGSALTGSTLLTDTGNGAPAGVQAGDTFSIAGTRPDGSTVATTFAVSGTTTVDDLLAALSAAFSTPQRSVAATLDAGRIRLTDSTGGDSRLAFNIAANNENGATLTFGASTIDAAGRLRQVAAGTDARVRVDGMLVQQSTNTIANVVSGVTLTLRAAEVGSPVALTVSRDSDSALAAIQKFAAAYNGVVDLTAKLVAADQPLAFDGALRAATLAVTNSLLGKVVGTTGTYTNPVMAGVALDKTGHLQVDAAAFRAALAADPAAIARLFSTSATTSTASLVSPSWTPATQPGSYTVNVTQAATTGSVTGSVLAGGYAAAGAADTITVNDTSTGRAIAVTLENGQSVETIVANLNARFVEQKLRVVASNANGALALTGTSYGSAAVFTVAYSDPAIAAQLGIAEGSYAGMDVQGTIGGLDSQGNPVSFAASGGGQSLRGGAGTPVEGLSFAYTGAATGAVGTIAFSLGVAGAMQRITATVGRPGDGVVALQTSLLQQDSDALDARISAVQTRLELKQNMLAMRFAKMENLLARVQSQGAFLNNFLSPGVAAAQAASAAKASSSNGR